MIRPFKNKRPRIAASAFVSEAAYVVGDVVIGEESSIWPGAVLRADFAPIRIGAGSHIEDNCVVHAGTELVIGDGVIVGHGAVIHCKSIGDHVLVGSQSTLLDGAEIGHYCIVAAGSLVGTGMKIPERSLAAGAPCRVRGGISSGKAAWLKDAAREYSTLARAYKEEGLEGP